MKELIITQSAINLVGDINANLQEMSSAVEVAVTDDATSLVGKLNTAFEGISDTEILSINDSAIDFVDKLNTNFEQGAAGPIVIDGIDEFNQTKYGTEMADTLTKVNAIKGTSDLLFLVSTDHHHEIIKSKTVIKNGTTYSVPLNYLQYSRVDTFAPMLSNQKEFIERARKNNIKVSGVVCLGDIFDGHRSDYKVDGETIMTAEEIVEAYTGDMLTKFKALSDAYELPFYMAVGNHDDNWDSNSGTDTQFSYQDLYNLYQNGYVEYDGRDEYLDYYVDLDDDKIRIVVLFCQPAAESQSYAVPMESSNYLKSCVNTLPNGYQVIIFCHMHPVMSAVIGGANDIMDYIAENNDKIIGYFCGHWHSDFVRGYPTTSFALCCNKNNDDASTHPNDGKDLWSVISIDKTNKLISMIRFAAYSSGANMYYTTTVNGEQVQKLITGYRDRIAHYEIINGEVNVNYTFNASLSGTITWGISSYSWFRKTGAGTSTGTYTYYNASQYAEMVSSDGSSCVVKVKAQDSNYHQFITVWAETPFVTEYWTIKIPKLS